MTRTLHVLAPGHVGTQEAGVGAKRLGSRLAFRLQYVGDHDPGAFRDEKLGDAAAQSPRSARNDRDLARQFTRHVHLLALPCLTALSILGRRQNPF